MNDEDMEQEVERVVDMLFDQEDIPDGAVIHVFPPRHATHAGWVAFLNRYPRNSEAPAQ